MSRKVLVAILRRNESDLAPEEKLAIEQAFAGADIEYRRIDPRDYIEHDQVCDDMKPDVVILPKDRPIPSLAMQHGFIHVEGSTGVLRKLLPLVPSFEPYVPSVAPASQEPVASQTSA